MWNGWEKEIIVTRAIDDCDYVLERNTCFGEQNKVALRGTVGQCG